MNQIKEICLKEKSKNPYMIWRKLIKFSNVPMHGPIHHIIDGAAFMTAMYNAGVKFNLDTALDELANRGSDMPGATCGKWGMCGSASSVGAALAIIHETGPLSSNEYYKHNLQLVSNVLLRFLKSVVRDAVKETDFLRLKLLLSLLVKHTALIWNVIIFHVIFQIKMLSVLKRDARFTGGLNEKSCFYMCSQLLPKSDSRSSR